MGSIDIDGPAYGEEPQIIGNPRSWYHPSDRQPLTSSNPSAGCCTWVPFVRAWKHRFFSDVPDSDCPRYDKVQECLRGHGVPSGSTGGKGRSGHHFRARFNRRSGKSEIIYFDGSQGISDKDYKKLYDKCMKRHKCRKKVQKDWPWDPGWVTWY
jgi:hypothetical protein